MRRTFRAHMSKRHSRFPICSSPFSGKLIRCPFQSGLLAGVAAQLLSFFRGKEAYQRRSTSQGAKDTVLALCYAALLLNIAATISAFMVIDKMGSVTMKGAMMPPPQIGRFHGTHVSLLVKFGGSPNWRYMLWHCECCVSMGLV